jgi:hypothetical protein
MDDSIITTSVATAAFSTDSVISTDRPADRNAAEIQITAPLRSAEAFETYCHHVQARLAEHALRRRSFLQNAYDRLTQLLHAARAVEDNALYNELWQVRLATRELLEALKHLSPSENSGWQTVPPPGKPTPMPTSNGHRSPGGDRSEAADNAAIGGRDTLTHSPLFVPGGPGGQAVVSAAPRLPRRPVRPLDDIEADAKRLREQIAEWKEQHPLQCESGSLNVPNCLRLRGWICRLRRLEEEAGDTEVVEVTEAIDDIVALLDTIGDEEYTVALDDELSPPPTAFQWGELGERYEETARAQEAFDWWYAHQAMLPNPAVQPVAEAVAAVQQRFNRLLFRIGARDPFQQRLFDSLRAWARESQCYLHSLRPKVPIAELIERASTLEGAWQNARDALNTDN